MHTAFLWFQVSEAANLKLSCLSFDHYLRARYIQNWDYSQSFFCCMISCTQRNHVTLRNRVFLNANALKRQLD